MFIKSNVLVSSVDMKVKKNDNSAYAQIGILSVDDGQKYDVSVSDSNIYNVLKPMTMCEMVLQVLNSQYGMRLAIIQVLTVGNSILGDSKK